VSFNAGVFADASGTPLGILAAARDITAQKGLERQLRDSQSYTRSLIESNIDALMTTDPLGIITDVNQQMEALTGWSREELIGSPFKEYFTDPNRAEQGIRLVLQKGRVTNYELTARSKDRLETVVSYNATTFNDQSGKLQGVFAAARDVTERKRFEQTLQEKNLELENANFAKDRFLASMSHELRTPLNAILGFTGTLLMRLPGPLTEDQEKQLKTIRGSANHQLSLINDLLDLAKIESGKVELQFEPVSSREVIEDLASTLGPLAEGKGLVFETHLRSGNVVMPTDRRALSQILINLVNNAIKFTEKGSVAIEHKHRQVNGHRTVEFTVVDTGIGIKPEGQAKLFQAFEQVDPSRRSEGTGLGLHLSQKLAALLGGHIEFQSEYGKGSRFSLMITLR
jgi:PAS domain S-box-containing protein